MGRFPDSTEHPGPTWRMDLTWGTFVLGRNGQQPDEELADWIREATDWFPYQREFGSWVTTYHWRGWAGSGSADPTGAPAITIELRTAAEIQAASGDPTALGYTGWADEPNMPPLDGLSDFNEDPQDQVAQGYRFIRCLIREDMASGGAGPQWSGRNFLIESVIHELGHATIMLLVELYSLDYVIENLCEMFGKPTSQWNNPSHPWGQRVIEATCEFFKDCAFPMRRYDSRAAYRLAESRFEDFRTLMFDYLEIPYWDMENTHPLWVRENQFFNNLGLSSYVTNNQARFLRLISDEEAAAHPNNYSWVNPGQLRWPLEGEIRIHYNYDIRPDVMDAGFGVWDTDFVFTDTPAPGNPGNQVNISLGGQLYTHSGVPFDGFDHHLLGSPAPSSGVFVIDPNDAAGPLPAEGFGLALGMRTAGPVPKFDLWSHVVGWFDNQIGMSYTWPWVEFAARAARRPLRAFPYPTYLSAPVARISAGRPRDGALRPGATRIVQGGSSRTLDSLVIE